MKPAQDNLSTSQVKELLSKIKSGKSLTRIKNEMKLPAWVVYKYHRILSKKNTIKNIEDDIDSNLITLDKMKEIESKLFYAIEKNMPYKSLLSLYKISVLTLFLFLSLNIKAQSKTIGKNKRGGKTSSELYQTFPDSTFHLMFRDEKYLNIDRYRTISFKTSSNNIDYFFSMLDSACTSKYSKDFSIIINLGIHTIEITQTKFITMTYAQIFSDVGSFTLTRKEVIKLFGK